MLVALLGSDAEKKALFPEGATATVTYRELPQHYPTLVLKQHDILRKKTTAEGQTEPDYDIKVHVGGTATTEYVVGETTVTEQDQNNQQVTVKKKTLTFNAKA